VETFGFAGQILKVDLSEGVWEREAIDFDMARLMIGGFGINTFLAYKEMRGGEDPFSEENPIILGCGPLVGTMTPGAVRIMATTKQPVNNAVASAAGSMSFGPRMKWAGYDHIIIKGIAKRPIYIFIQDGNVNLIDASDLWGMDIPRTTEEMWRRHGNVGVIAIGPAGESLIKFSLCLVDRTATLGRGGLGAVMGSKRLKAIVISGTKGLKIYDPKGFFQLVDRLFERVRSFSGHSTIVEYGLMAGWDSQKEILFHGLKFEREAFLRDFGPDIYSSKFRKRRAACPSCFIPCKDVIEFQVEGRKERSFPTSFINVPLIGALFTPDPDEAAFLHERLNQLGLDFMTFSTLASWVIDHHERGGIPPSMLRYKKIKRDLEGALFIIELILKREGIGEVLSEGWPGVIDRFGVEAVEDYPIIRGQDALFDPRASGLGTMEFEQIVCPRGPTSATAGSPTYLPGVPVDKFQNHCDRMGIPRDAIDRIFHPIEGFNVGRLTRYAEDWYSLLSSLGLCMRAHNNRFYSAQLCAELYKKVTGISIDREGLMKGAERIWNLFRIINFREGFGRKDDTVPEVWFKPVRCYGEIRKITDYYRERELSREDLKHYLDSYYEERGWDLETGLPTSGKLKELGLEWTEDKASLMH
jgi:aldehyde:ferredoxin oxidoreductase